AHPRYAELLARRGGALPAPAEARAIARRFSTDDLRDLQVWHKLAWIDPEYQEQDPRVRRLIAKDRNFSEEDKATIRGCLASASCIPRTRPSSSRGRSTTTSGSSAVGRPVCGRPRARCRTQSC